jgi:hypothetical protein
MSPVERIQDDNNLLGLFLSKSVVYRHEQEVRAIFLGGGPEGYFIPVALDKLVGEVRVSPLAPEWFQFVVEETCKRFGFSFPVTRSGAMTAFY